MVKSALRKAAEILVECGYANRLIGNSLRINKSQYEFAQPFADTLEGRRQLDALYQHITGVSPQEQIISKVKIYFEDQDND